MTVLLIDRVDKIALVTLNRPEATNALSRSLRHALWRAMTDLAADDTVSIVVLTGAGPAFTAGLDLKELGADGLAPPTRPALRKIRY